MKRTKRQSYWVCMVVSQARLKMKCLHCPQPTRTLVKHHLVMSTVNCPQTACHLLRLLRSRVISCYLLFPQRLCDPLSISPHGHRPSRRQGAVLPHWWVFSLRFLHPPSLLSTNLRQLFPVPVPACLPENSNSHPRLFARVRVRDHLRALRSTTLCRRHPHRHCSSSRLHPRGRRFIHHQP